MHTCSLAICAGIAALLPGLALAQDNALIIDRGRADRATVAPPVVQPVAPPRLPGAQVAKIKPFILRKVQIDGSSLTPLWLRSVIQRHIGTWMDEKSLARLSAQIAALYGEHSDIAFYTVTVPKQAFKHGVLRLAATEGYVESVDIQARSTRRLSLVKSYAAALMAERPLKRSTLQRKLSLLRDIAGLKVETRLARGTAPGALHLVLILEQKPWYLALSANDQGSNPLGRIQFQAKASLYGLFRQGEETALLLAAPFEVRRFQYIALNETLPLSANGLMLHAGIGYLRTRPHPPYPQGDATNAQLLISYPLLRSFDENLQLTVGVDGINSSNATLGEIIANERIRAARLSSAYAAQSARAAFALNVSLSQGLNIFGARTKFPALSNTGFQKAAAQTRYTHLIGHNWVARLSASGQFAFALLPVSELYGLGGETARAFPAAAAMGDSGLAVGAELGYQPARLPPLLQGLELFAFADGGSAHLRHRANLAARDFRLASTGAGFRLPFRSRTKIEIAAANGLYSSAPGIPAHRWRFTFALSTAS